MSTIDLVCKECSHAFQIVTRTALKEKQKCCPACTSANVRQTVTSFLRNGALSDARCGAAPQRSSGFG
jgi:putative FmdB family regulatory protein